jgi:hypothetical protein
MLNAAPITDRIAEVLRSIPALAAAMTVADAAGNPICRIAAFHYRLGQENRLAETIYQMPAPSMLVAWEGTAGGNFDGQTIWKHRWGIYYRMGNAAGVASPVGYEDLWAITCNDPPGGTGPNIRNIQLHAGLDIMDTPSIDHALDEDLIDRFKGVFIFPELGDN